VMAEFIEEVELVAQMQAEGFGLQLRVSPVDAELAVDADRQLLASAVSNLLQNAFKFTRPHGTVSLLTHATADRALIEIWDECRGLPEGKAEELFLPFTQAGVDRSGLGLGLSIAQSATRANGGEVSVRNIPGTGCVFTIDLPRRPLPPLPTVHDRPHEDRAAPESSGNGSESRSQTREPKARAS
jgi:signal transduction histidine kinase